MPKVFNIKRNAPDTAVLIDRRTEAGNPFILYDEHDTDERNVVCDQYEEWLKEWYEKGREVSLRIRGRVYSNKTAYTFIITHLRGKDVKCWCAPKRCHGDTVIRLANQ